MLILPIEYLGYVYLNISVEMCKFYFMIFHYYLKYDFDFWKFIIMCITALSYIKRYYF